MIGDLLIIGTLLIGLLSIPGAGYAVDRATAMTVGTASPSIKSTEITHSGPTWTALSTSEQQALAPLASEWDKLKPDSKKKWLTISKRYAAMKPTEQTRLQERMRDWVKLTPDQRRIVRENYARANKLDTEQRARRWQQYQQLSDEQKKEFATRAKPHHKHVTTLPPIKPPAPATAQSTPTNQSTPSPNTTVNTPTAK